MGHTQEYLENADLNALVIARTGRLEMLNNLFGVSKDPEVPPQLDPNKPTTGGGDKPLELTPAVFDTLFS